MIVRMNKVTVLTVAHDRANTLEALRQLGVVHVQPVVTPAGTSLEQARETAANLQVLLGQFPAVADAKPTGRAADAVVADAAEWLAARNAKKSELDSLQTEASRIAPFGSFDPADVQALAAKGIHVKLYRASAKRPPALPDGVLAEKLSTAKNDAYWALVGHAPFEWEGADEQRLPAASLDALNGQMQQLQDELIGIDQQFASAAGDRGIVEQQLVLADAEVKLQEVRAGMGAAEAIAYVQGFAPAADVEKIRAAAASHGWGLVVDEPGAADDVPVKLKPPRWATPINAVFQGINILPAYNEADVSVLFMLFFSLFFAMIVGDAGYGAIFLGLTWFLRKKLPVDAFRLLMITSAATIVWGVLTGTYFGMPDSIVSKLPLASLQVPFLTSPESSAQNIMGLCFLIGAVHISISHLWNVWDLALERNLKALEQLGWFMTTVFMFFLADSVVINGHMAGFLHLGESAHALLWKVLAGMAITGVAFIILFMMPPRDIKTEWFNLALLPLDLVGNFTDVVSYVRLYAVGTASFAVAEAFNKMIFGGDTPWWGLLIGALLAFLAHTLNILLSIMGVLVHGIRLNTLEFANHKGISWSGSPYRPFSKPDIAA